MAFAWFRRRQKMVMIIMAVLMVSFLVGYQGCELVMSRDQGKKEYGNFSGEKITYNDRSQAVSDISLLRQMGFDRFSLHFIWLTAHKDNADTAYAILLKQADKAGVRVSPTDISNTFAGMGLTGDALTKLISRVREQGITEEKMRDAVGRWLAIERMYEGAAVKTPPSDAECRYLFKQLAEEIDLRVLKIPAEKFVKDIAEPNETQLNQQFVQFRAVFPDQYPNMQSFGFGYRQFNKVRIAYMKLDSESLQRGLTPDNDTIRKFWRQTRARYTKQVPLSQPATASAPAGTSAPATAATTSASTSAPADVPTHAVELTYEEARDKVIADMTADAVQRKGDELLGLAETMTAELYQRGGKKPAEVYKTVLDRFTIKPDKLLAAKFDVNLDNVTLRAAVRELEKLANLNVIVFPWGKQGDKTLDPNVLVSLKDRKDITLAEALNSLLVQSKMDFGKIDWVMCDKVEGALFPVGGVDLFPFSIGESQLMDEKQLRDDPLLSKAVTSYENPLWLMAAALTAAAFPDVPEDRGIPRMKVGEEGQRMYIVPQGRGEMPDRLLWTLAEAVPAHEPATMTEDIRKQVIADFKTLQAYGKADELARKIQTAAGTMGLEAAAKAEGLETTTTGLFSRSTLRFPAQQAYYEALMRGNRERPLETYFMPEVDIGRRPVPGLPMPTAALNETMLTNAFLLAPPNVEPPYPESGVQMNAIPPIKQVVLLQRHDYRPPVTKEYEDGTFVVERQKVGKDFLKMVYIDTEQKVAARLWFTPDDVMKRTNFQFTKQ